VGSKEGGTIGVQRIKSPWRKRVSDQRKETSIVDLPGVVFLNNLDMMPSVLGAVGGLADEGAEGVVGGADGVAGGTIACLIAAGWG